MDENKYPQKKILLTSIQKKIRKKSRCFSGFFLDISFHFYYIHKKNPYICVVKMQNNIQKNIKKNTKNIRLFEEDDISKWTQHN